jgi:hypothetical protein
MKMTLIRRPYNDYLADLKEGKPFTLSRFNDGEWMSILGFDGRNTDNCAFPIAAIGLRTALESAHPIYYGSSNHTLRQFRSRVNSYLTENKIKVEWYDADVFHKASMRGLILPFFSLLKKKKVLLVAPDIIKRIYNRIAYRHHVSVPDQNATAEVKRIVSDIYEYWREEKPNVILFCAGFATNIMIDNLYSLIGEETTMIDMGSVLDPYCGVRSRSYMRSSDFRKVLRLR